MSRPKAGASLMSFKNLAFRRTRCVHNKLGWDTSDENYTFGSPAWNNTFACPAPLADATSQIVAIMVSITSLPVELVQQIFEDVEVGLYGV